MEAVQRRAREHANNLRAIVEDTQVGTTRSERWLTNSTAVPYSSRGGERRPMCGFWRLERIGAAAARDWARAYRAVAADSVRRQMLRRKRP